MPSYLQPGLPQVDLTRGYLDAMLDGDVDRASALVHQAIKGGVAVRDIYLHVLPRAQYEIGRLWKLNRVSIAQEHYCSATTQRVLGELAPLVCEGARLGPRLFVAAPPGALHEIGPRIVADVMEMDGWDTTYLGSRGSFRDVVGTAGALQADAVALSATMPLDVTAVERQIDALRRSDTCQTTRILVGGRAFNATPDLWREVGADAWAPGPNEASDVLRRLAPDLRTSNSSLRSSNGVHGARRPGRRNG